MTREEAIENLESIIGTYEILQWHGVNSDILLDDDLDAIRMAISALKDIKKIQNIVDAYFTRGGKSGYECMGEIDSILEPYQKGGE